MPLPSFREQFAALIAAPSVSCTQPNWDQSNAPVIELQAVTAGNGGGIDGEQFSRQLGQLRPDGQNLLQIAGMDRVFFETDKVQTLNAWALRGTPLAKGLPNRQEVESGAEAGLANDK